MLLLRRGGEDERPPVPGADAGVLSEERVAAVRRALGRLSLRDRQMLVLRHEGYSYREIADALGIANSSVGTLLVRATAAFAAAVEGEDHASD
jgi:RNA polymerase sigma factor (sigma-70 family)